MKYIHIYTSFSDYSSIIKNFPDISLISGMDNLVIFNHNYNIYEHKYLTFEILTSGTVIWKMVGSGASKTISYSINDGEWNSITSTGDGINLNVSSGDIIKFKGTNSAYAKDKNNYSAFYGGTATYNAYGNIMSLIWGDNYEDKKELTSAWVLSNLFNHSNLVSAENLIFPATILTENCYRATFANSPLLTTSPALPATVLETQCYYYMFDNCTSLVNAPELLAPTLAVNCYYGMFHQCSSLNYIKCLATNISASSCTTIWVDGVAVSGTFIKDPNMSSWSTGVNGIPTGWISADYSELTQPIISCDGEEIELTCPAYGSTIYYRLNSTGEYIQYTTPIVINTDTFIEAYSELDGEISNTISQTCIYVYESKLDASNKSISTWNYNNQTITTPYSVNAIDGHSGSYATGTFNFETTLTLKKVQPTYLWFQHADQSASIYVDNVLVEKHWGGYTAFFVDITNYIHKGSNNIKVALKNNEGNNLAPASGDFNFNATLGNVKLFTSPVLPDIKYGYDGFHVTSTVSSSSATIYVRTTIPSGARVVCTISDENYNYSDTQNSNGLEMTFSTTISNPHLWHGTIDPHLYTITLEIYYNNELYHRFQRGYGLRYYSYVINETVNGETYTGFLLNGQPYLLRGVCMHHDIEGKANALSDTDIANDFNIISELGCNFIRLAHYPHPKEIYDWCDTLGIVVETEAPCVNKLQSTMPADYYTHLEGQYTDMVNQHYNHPCILFWCLSNETSTDDKDFAKTKIEGYVSLIKNLDSERLVGYVLNQGNGTNPSGYYNNPSNVDWFGCNIYVGWYDSPNSNNPTQQINTRLNNTVNASIHKPMAFSEYGCGGTQRCHSANPSSTTTRGSNQPRHDIEYMMWLHEGHIAAIKNFPQLLFTSQWVLFDFAVKSRQEGYTICLDGETTSTDNNLKYLNNKGLVERDHITKKDTFYLYKAWWNQTDKFVHICGKDYEKYTNRVIKCYTNDGNSLKLYVDDSLIEVASVTNNIATFTARNYAPGVVIRVEGDGTNDTLNVIDYTAEYLTFDILSDGNITWKMNSSSATAKTISYSKNGGDWISITSTTSGVNIPVVTGDKLRFKGSNVAYSDAYLLNNCNSFESTCYFYTYGNIMSLIGGDNFFNLTTLSTNYTFTCLFYGCTKLVFAKNLILPATTLTSNCYRAMFNGCTGLTSAPELPATTLSDYCYASMFIHCTSLTTTPALPAITLASHCYWHMFNDCSSLTTAPVLPATTLSDYCYSNMFYGCTSLTSAPELPATTLENYCYDSMFRYCTSLTSAPILPAVTLVASCYYYMFDGCSNLNYIKCLATSISATSCTYKWVNSVASTGIFVKADNMSSWTTGVNGIPTGWTVLDKSYTEYLTFDIKSDGNITWKASNANDTKTISYSKNGGTWTNITSTTSGVSIPVTVGDKVRFKGINASYCLVDYTNNLYSNTFNGTATFDVYGNIMSLIWGDNFVNTTTPSLLTSTTFKDFFMNSKVISAENLILPATTLAEYCYNNMFKGCTLLTTAPVLPATILNTGCYLAMFYGCTSLTTAPELPATTLVGSCYQYMFYGCSNLNYIKCLATNISANTCVDNWVNGVATTGTFVKNSSMSSWSTDSSGIPSGWTVEDAA